MSILNPLTWFRRSSPELKEKKPEPDISAISPGRVSVPNDSSPANTIRVLGETAAMVNPSFRTELIPLIRDLYKINPDMSIAVQDMFKLANTDHIINFPNNTAQESEKMRKHLKEASKKWSRYTAGINGLVNKMICQTLIGGAISVEAVPDENLDGLSTLLFLNPEDILFKREDNGVYQPYQINRFRVNNKKPSLIKLNTETYQYIGMYNDVDEPYGIPPFLGALDSLKTQHDMRINFKQIMELMGMVGFLEAKMQKPARKGSESDTAYAARLSKILRDLKKNLKDGMKDGIVTGFIDDHEFEMNSTSASMQNLDIPWKMNEQAVANGLGVTSTIIGVQTQNTEGGAGIMLSKMISQLKNIQMMVTHALEFIYTLELRLAGLPNKGIEVTFGTSTVSDEIKVQQAQEYKIKNVISKYNQGLISQDQAAWELGYAKADQKEPRIPLEDAEGVSTPNRKREADKDTSDRKTRDKNNPTPKRKDQDSRPR